MLFLMRKGCKCKLFCLVLFSGVPVVGQGVTIATRGTGDVWMLVQGRVCFRNIVFVIEAGFSELSMKTAIHVLSGFLDIKECSFCNNGGVKFGLQKVWLESDYFIVGIEMNSSSQLRLADCKMCGFHIALKLHDTAKVSLEKAEIHDSHYGFEVRVSFKMLSKQLWASALLCR